MINHHFLALGPLKPVKSNPGGQNLPGVLFRDHSDHWGPVPAQIHLKNDGLAIEISKIKKEN